ncbi:MAG: hypothetical protein K2Q18_09470 [Bdellovibrionales bacterium]|nr:hypothetical protein [Bdellovibrionales bacterium]
MRFFLVFLLFFTSMNAFSVETCSRIAIINYQEVLVDSNTSQRGEGLRYHLEKDPLAKQYLDTYQKNSGIRWPSAVLGTAGTGLLLYGFFNSDSENRRLFIISGTATILVNFLVARTLEVANESNLNKAIEEYNKRNLPKIFFNPEGTQSQNSYFSDIKIGLVQQWTF